MTYEERAIVLAFIESLRKDVKPELFAWLVNKANAEFQRTLQNLRNQ